MNLLGLVSQASSGAALPTGYQIERSLRFNSADSAYLSRTPGSAGNRKTWTWSGWVKRSSFITTRQCLFSGYSAATDAGWLEFGFGGSSDSDTQDCIYVTTASLGINSTAVFRDPSAWYHIVVAFDTTQATSTNRLKVWVNNNNLSVPALGTLSLNLDAGVNQAASHTIGRSASAITRYFNGYLADINFIDGSALDPTSFGEYNEDTGVWQPKAYEGSYGTNGFYLNFSDNSGTTSSTLGKDQAGSNDWTPNNFSVTAGAGNDSLVDTPTPYGTDTGAGGEVRGNYCTWNPVRTSSGITLSNGNLDAISGTAAYRGGLATMSSPSGKFYFEARINAVSSGNNVGIGIGSSDTTLVGRDGASDVDFMYLDATNNTGSLNYSIYGNNNTYTAASLGGSSVGDIMMVAYDYDTGKLWLGANGTWYNSGNPAEGTNAAATMTNPLDKFFYVVSYSSSSCSANFGQRPFTYTAPSGFKALVTTNLPAPAAVDSSEYFNTVLYTGDASSPRAITGVGFQPDFVWIKPRSSAFSHGLHDAVRGSSRFLISNSTNAELVNDAQGSVSSFNSDGFTITAGATNNINFNNSGTTHVAWNWKANGAGSSNTDGSITSTVSVNTTSGFSIVTYTGTGANATIGHGLGVKPAFIITKQRSAVSGIHWRTYHQSLTANVSVYLNLTNAATGTDAGFMNLTEPTSTVFTVGTDTNINGSGQPHIAYCFAAVPGFSAFGSYGGNSSTDGTFVYLGFRPAFVLIKAVTASSQWSLRDSSRLGYNELNYAIEANQASAESTATAYKTDLLSNGFKCRTTDDAINKTGTTYIYMAFAENPFKYSLAR